MRLLVFNLATDADDPVLGFASGWVRALAPHCERVCVLTMRAGRLDLPPNVSVVSAGKERGYTEARRVIEFYRQLGSTLRRNAIDACFSHMIPVFSVLAAPVLRRRGIPLVTWYAHPELTWTLRLAHHLSDRMVTSVRTAYPYRHDKLTVLGQGIDTELFRPDGEVGEDAAPLVLCVGRLSPVKDHLTLIRAAAVLRDTGFGPFQVVIVGGPATARDEAYARALGVELEALGLAGIVRFERPRAMPELVRWYRGCAVHANMTPTGSGDKVVWEAMSCGRPSVAANTGFRETLGDYGDALLYRYGDAEHLAERLRWVLGLPAHERLRIGLYLRDRVARSHSLTGLARKLVGVLTSVSVGRPGVPGLAEVRGPAEPKVHRPPAGEAR